MDDYINKLYALFYKPLVTPYNLLENARLDNYKYVKYYTKGDSLIVEMKCIVVSNETIIFYYYFDNNNSLQKIYQKTSSSPKELLFDRQNEFQKLVSEYYTQGTIQRQVN